jgi:hypothetical protein
MHRELRQRIKEATEKSGINKLDFIELLKVIDEHYDKMEATITQTIATQSLTIPSVSSSTPIDLIFDSVTEALLSVGDQGIIRNCNKVCSRYFGIAHRFACVRHFAGCRGPVAERLPPTIHVRPRRCRNRIRRR